MTTLHETDYMAWLQTQMDCIRRRDFERLDIINLLEEMEEMGGSFKDAIESHLTNLIMHMLKTEYQPEMSCNSWNASITNARVAIKRIIRKNPSLKKYPEEVMESCYQDSINGASRDTGISVKMFAKECPWALNEILKGE